MRTQIYDINLVVGAGIPPIVKVSQNDELRVLAFRLFDGIREYFPFENEEVTITGTKPSGLGFTEVCNIIGSLATVETTLAMTQESGSIKAELRISDGSTNIGTANFTLYVEPAPHPAGTTDGTTEEARTVLEQCEQYAQEAQEAAEAASGDYTQLSAEIGTLSELTTTAKSSAVAAINEVNSGLSDAKADLDNIDVSLSDTAIQLLETILNAAVYTSDQSANIDALIEELSSDSNVDSITVENGVMTILGLANTPTLSNGILSIA